MAFEGEPQTKRFYNVAARIEAMTNWPSGLGCQCGPARPWHPSGGRVLVLDDTDAGAEITVRGFCQKIIDRRGPGACAVSMPTGISMARSDFCTFEEIIEAPNAVPSIPIGLEHDVMPSSVVRITVVFGQQVDLITLLRGARFQVKAYLQGHRRKVVYHQDRVVPPIIAQDQDLRCAREEYGE